MSRVSTQFLARRSVPQDGRRVGRAGEEQLAILAQGDTSDMKTGVLKGAQLATASRLPQDSRCVIGRGSEVLAVTAQCYAPDIVLVAECLQLPSRGGLPKGCRRVPLA